MGRKGLNVKTNMGQPINLLVPVRYWTSWRGSDHSLLHPGFFTGRPVSCVGCHASLPVVLIRVKTGCVARRAARRGGGLRLDHYVGSWGWHTRWWEKPQDTAETFTVHVFKILILFRRALPLEPWPSLDVRPMRLERCVCTRGMNWRYGLRPACVRPGDSGLYPSGS